MCLIRKYVIGWHWMLHKLENKQYVKKSCIFFTYKIFYFSFFEPKIIKCDIYSFSNVF